MGGIAQSEEHALCKREAPGSKPGTSTLNQNESCSISLVVRTPRCGRGNPGSNPGWNTNYNTLLFFKKSGSSMVEHAPAT